MLYSYLKICLRNIKRHKLFSLINIFGLTLALTICIAVLMVVKHQFEMDNFHPYSDRTYRVITEVTYDYGQSLRLATTPLPLGKQLEENYPFIETSVQFYRTIFSDGIANEKKLEVEGAFTEPSFFKVFGFQLKYGNPETALDKPFSIIFSQKTAQKFFGYKNPVGELFKIEGLGDFTITGVLKPQLDDTHLQFKILASFSTLPLLQKHERYQEELKAWQADTYNYPYTYVLLKNKNDRELLESNLNALAQRIQKNYEVGSRVSAYDFSIQPLANASHEGGIRYSGKGMRWGGLVASAIIPFIILLMACFNYTNLSIARALKRAKEVGMYKVWGAKRSQIIIPSVLQATFISIISLILAYALLPFIPLPRDLLREINAIDFDWMLGLYLFLFALFTGLLAGVLPAWLLSSINPVDTFKDVKNMELVKGLTLRKILVVAQFAISLALIIITVTIYSQTNFTVKSDYGFRKENIINLSLQDVDYELMKNELSGITGIKQISGTSRLLGIFPSEMNLKKNKKGTPINVDYYNVDLNFIENMDLEIIAGGGFNTNTSTNKMNSIVVNQVFLNRFGYDDPSNAIGKIVWLNDSTQFQIAGVLKDFNYRTLRMSISSLALVNNPSETNYLNIRVASNRMGQVIPQIKKAWEKVAPIQPVSLISTKDYLYRSHGYEQTNASIAFFAFIAISIAALGLLGMVTYTVEVRTREVGIRKVLGAGVGKVILLLSKEFLWLIGIAALIGLPAGYFLGYQFLNMYAYHINMGVGILSFGLGVLLLTGLGAIGFQTWRVANTNPVDSIRTE